MSPKRRKVVPVTTTMEPEMMARLNSMSDECGAPRAYLIRQAIRQFVRAAEQQKAQQPGTPSAQQREANAS